MPTGFLQITGIGATHRLPPALPRRWSSIEDTTMSTTHYPFLVATLGEAAGRLPDDLARTLESTLAATQPANSGDGPTLLACLRHIRQGDGADGQPVPGRGRSASQRAALARLDRATAGMSVLLEVLHAAERVRVDGEPDQQVGDDVREGLLLACRGLCEYMGTQLPTG